MKYLTAEELKTTEKEHAHEILERCVGKSVRDRYALRVFLHYHDIYFKDRATTSILDLGAGNGFFANQIHGEGFRTISGTDIDNYLNDETTPLFRRFEAADLSTASLPWPDASFDMVTAWCVIPHLENPHHAVREIQRVVKPGGIVIITVPYLSSRPSREYFWRHGDFKSYRATNNHIALFTPGVMKKTILRYFEKVGEEYHFRPSVFEGARGKLRRIVWKMAGKKLRKKIAERWAYNLVLVLKKPE